MASIFSPLLVEFSQFSAKCPPSGGQKGIKNIVNPVSVILAFIALILMGNTVMGYMRAIIKNQEAIIHELEAILALLQTMQR